MPSEIHISSRVDPETKCLQVRCGAAGDDKAQLLAELSAIHAAYCRLGDTYERQAVWAEEYTDFATDVKGVNGGFRLFIKTIVVIPSRIHNEDEQGPEELVGLCWPFIANLESSS